MQAFIGPPEQAEACFVLDVTGAAMEIAPPLQRAHLLGEPVQFFVADAKQVSSLGVLVAWATRTIV